jgi:hypothetical protein
VLALELFRRNSEAAWAARTKMHFSDEVEFLVKREAKLELRIYNSKGDDGELIAAFCAEDAFSFEMRRALLSVTMEGLLTAVAAVQHYGNAQPGWAPHEPTRNGQQFSLFVGLNFAGALEEVKLWGDFYNELCAKE